MLAMVIMWMIVLTSPLLCALSAAALRPLWPTLLLLPMCGLLAPLLSMLLLAAAPDWDGLGWFAVLCMSLSVIAGLPGAALGRSLRLFLHCLVGVGAHLWRSQNRLGAGSSRA